MTPSQQRREKSDICTNLGAKVVSESSSPSIVNNLTAALQNRVWAGADDGMKPLQIFWSSTNVIPAIEVRDSTMIDAALAQLRGGFIASAQKAPKDILATVRVKQGRILSWSDKTAAGTNIMTVYGSSIPAGLGGVGKAIHEELSTSNPDRR